METNSPHAWFLAARPKTLTGAAVPVMIGIALAFHDAGTEDFRIIPAILCMLFAFVMQIDANFINDYFDFKRGNDDETRLGPKRACSEGWITPSAMLKGIIATTLFGCAIGLPLIYYGGLEMIMVGLVCVVFCFLYTTLFSYLGLGDVLVLIFFGIIPVCVTQYLCAAPTAGVGLQGINIEGLLIALACGIVIELSSVFEFRWNIAEDFVEIFFPTIINHRAVSNDENSLNTSVVSLAFRHFASKFQGTQRLAETHLCIPKKLLEIGFLFKVCPCLFNRVFLFVTKNDCISK